MSIILHFKDKRSNADIRGCEDAVIIQEYELSIFRNDTQLHEIITVRYKWDNNLQIFIHDYTNKIEKWEHRREHAFDYEEKFCAVALKQFDINTVKEYDLKTGDDVLITYDAGVPHEVTGLYETLSITATLKLLDQRVVYK